MRPCISQGCGQAATVIPILLVWPHGADRNKTSAYRMTMGGMLLCREHGVEVKVKKFLQGSLWDQVLDAWRTHIPTRAEPDRDSIQVMWKPIWVNGAALRKA